MQVYTHCSQPAPGETANLHTLPALPANCAFSQVHACMFLSLLQLQNNGNWSWVNEGTAAKPKWGYVSWNRGASLVLKVDTRASEHQHDSSTSSTAAGSTAAGSTKMGSKASSHSKTPAGRSATQSMQAGAAGSYPSMIVWVGYLKGSRHMGSATVSCISGCQCQSTSVDAMHGESNTQQHMTRLYTTEAAECLVEVKVGQNGQNCVCISLASASSHLHIIHTSPSNMLKAPRRETCERGIKMCNTDLLLCTRPGDAPAVICKQGRLMTIPHNAHRHSEKWMWALWCLAVAMQHAGLVRYSAVCWCVSRHMWQDRQVPATWCTACTRRQTMPLLCVQCATRSLVCAMCI